VAGLPAVGIAVEVGDQDGEMVRIRRQQVAAYQSVAQSAPIEGGEKYAADHRDQQPNQNIFGNRSHAVEFSLPAQS
jgi:hypothetical protein